MRKRYYGIILAIVVLFVVFYSLRQVGDSRTFQFFGEIIPRVDTPKKVVALTFDDGPTSCCTEKILGILGNTNVKATFFVTGRELEQNLAEGQKIVAAGHELGNHSYYTRECFSFRLHSSLKKLKAPTGKSEPQAITGKFISDRLTERNYLFHRIIWREQTEKPLLGTLSLNLILT